MAVSDFTIPDVPPRIQYEAAAGQEDFTIPFRFFQNSDIKVTIGSDQTPISSSLYTIVGAGTNTDGTLSFLVGRAEDDVVTIYRDSEISRTTNFQNSGEWTAQNVNDQFNRVVTFLQEIALKAVDLAVRLPINTMLTSITFPDEGPLTNSGKVIMWNVAGNALINGPSAQNIEDANQILEDIQQIALDVDADATAAANSATAAYNAQLLAEAAAAGIRFRAPVRVTSTANVNIASAPASIDTVTLVSGDRVALKDQTTPSQNGIYVFNGTGAAMTRSSDADTWAELPGLAVIVMEGAVWADRLLICTSNTGGTIGVTSITFSELVVTVVDNSITTNKIANLAITFGKLAVALVATRTQIESQTASVLTTADLIKYHPAMPKVWVMFDGTGTPSIKSSYGVSSITDNGVGDYTINFSVTMADAFFTTIGNMGISGGGVGGLQISAQTTTSVRVLARQINNNTITYIDNTINSVAVYGALAP